jgi:PAS domain S-box-containing protein
MPFSKSSGEVHLFNLLQMMRGNRPLAYAMAVGAVALAVLVRLAIGLEFFPGVSFITLYPAIFLSAFLGGLGPGILAIILSSVAAWYFFIPPFYSFAFEYKDAFLLFVFIAINAINVALVVILNWALARVFAREQEMRSLIETAPGGIVVIDDEGKVTLVNASTEKLFGYTRLELIGQNIDVLVPDRLVNAHEALRKAYMTSPETRPMGRGRDLSARRKDGGEFPVEIGLNALSRDGQHVVLATVVDISERRKAVEEQRLMINEMRHRTQNLFAIVHAVASKSLDEKQSVAEAKTMLLGRIEALARAHAMLADAAWQGAPLDQIVRRTLDAFTDRATVTGCNITINPSAAQQFALIVHELATNATKYGALSVPTGRISIEGTVNGQDAGEETFSFRWQESGGPPATLPIRRGFGSSILIDAAKGFSKRAALDYATTGVTYELVVPLTSIQVTTLPASLGQVHSRVS